MSIKVAKKYFSKKLKILTPLQKLPKNARGLGKLIVAIGFEKLPKVQKMAQSAHTACKTAQLNIIKLLSTRLATKKLIYECH